jgi:hypothetical protein
VTDPELVHRAEQAYLGALLARRGQAGTGTAVAGAAGPAALAGLSPQDFTDPVHQAVYAALASQALPARAGLGAVYERLRGALTRLLSGKARAAAAYMSVLPGLCPDPANMAAYAAMVADASQARAAAAPAATTAATASRPARQPRQRPAAENPRLASAAQWLDGGRADRHQSGTRQADPAYAAPPSQPRRTPDGLDRQTARLARALGADARRLAVRAAPPAAPPPAPAGNPPAPLSAGALQEQVLADLMLHPASRGGVTPWLPAAAFTAGTNRTLYQLVRLRLDGGRPVDPLIIAWDASALADAPGPGTGHGESLAAAALRLGALNPAPGTAAVLAQPLYAEQVCADAFGPDWRNERRPVPAAVPAAAVPAPAPAADPAPAAGPEQAGQDPAAGPRPGAAANAAGQAEPAPAAAGHTAPAPPPAASGLPLRRPPTPGRAEPGPAPLR